jgi:hexosaminidase
MRHRQLAALPALFLALAAGTASGQSALQLRWELASDVFEGGDGRSQAVFTLTNRDAQPLAASGWAIYFNALHSAQDGSVGSGFAIEDVTGDLHRLVPGTGFAGLAPGASVRIEYLTQPLLNVSFAPKGPYIVFDAAKDTGHPLNDYVAVAFERPPQGEGRNPRVVTAQHQFALDSVIRDIPASELPPVFPTPLEVTWQAGALRLTAMPPIEAPVALRNAAGLAEEYLRPYFANARKSGNRRCDSRWAPSPARPRSRPTRWWWIPLRASASSAPRPPACSTGCSRCAA